jgi:hypothetical protein
MQKVNIMRRRHLFEKGYLPRTPSFKNFRAELLLCPNNRQRAAAYLFEVFAAAPFYNQLSETGE